MKTSIEWFTDSTVFYVIALMYEKQGLVGNAHWFAVRSIYALAKGLEMMAHEGARKG